MVLRSFDPAKALDVFDAARFQRENHFGQIEALHFRYFMGGARLLLVRGPKAQALAGSGAPSAAGALIGGGSADFFDQQSVDAAIRIVTGNSRETAVDHETHAIDGERSFGDIGGDHDL